jgi:lysophospholipase L1-like esterase
VLLALGTFLVAGEVVTRASGMIDRLNGFSRRLFVATDDPRRPYEMRPGADMVVRGFRVKLNEQGLRTPSFSPRPAPGVRRVLALGDSATFGERLPVEEAFPALLERELVARSGERWEVINAGVEGYNTEAELAFLERRGVSLAPEVVVVGFNLNDFDRAPSIGPHGVLTHAPDAGSRRRSLADVSEFWFLLRALGNSRDRALLVDPSGVPPGSADWFDNLDRYVSALRKAYYRRPDDARWPTLVRALRGFGEIARAHGVRLVIAILPDGDQVGVREPDLVPQARLRAVCADAGLDCLDLYPAFAAAAEGGADLFLDIAHPNAAGQRLIARALADRLLGSRR